MKLLLDLGNSRLKWAWLEAGALHEPGAVTHDGQLRPDVTAALEHAGHRPREIVMASVASPDLTRALADRLGCALGVAVHRVATGSAACGVRNGYRDHRQLGVDRWLALVGAFTRYRQALCVVDVGTAVTIDALDGDGEHLGGYIVPGPALMRSSLLHGTGQLAGAAGAAPAAERDVDLGFGRDSDACMRRGALGAIAALAERALLLLAQRGGQPLLVLTGGGADELVRLLPEPRVHPLLVLEGLAACCAEAGA